MRFFLDTANLTEIREAADIGIIAGVTTNPSLVAKEGHKDFHGTIQTIASMIDGPVSAEVISLDWAGMVQEADTLASLAHNVVIKIPMTKDGLRAVHLLSEKGIKTNVTLIFSATQALLAARAGASYVSPFVGRLDDISMDGMQLVRDVAEIFFNHEIDTEIIAASVRHPIHVIEAAKAGAHIATVPWKVMEQMMKHPLTDAGIKKFMDDWKAVSGK